MSVVRQVRELFQSDAGPDEQPPVKTREKARLFRCHACAETYITIDMDRCPSCEDAVEHIPSERDLGFV